MPINPPPNNGPFANFYPKRCTVTAITNAFPAAVTTTTNHGYIDGIIVRIDVSSADGMAQIDQQFSPITVTGNMTFTLNDIDSTFYDVFADESSTSKQYSFGVPIGEINSILTAATVNILPL